MKIVTQIEDLRNTIKHAKSSNKIVGLVPTMGCLHEGHQTLIQQCMNKCDYVVVSIFVNPLQFNVANDFIQYPRPWQEDEKVCNNLKVDVLFIPDTKEIYPTVPLFTTITINKLTDNLCGGSRPGHFAGVAIIISKLFNIIMPNYIALGKKDIQQLRVIETFIEELNYPIKVIACETVRNKNGLALSSRNKHLSLQEQEQSLILSNSLNFALNLIKDGITEVIKIKKAVTQAMQTTNLAKLDYFEIVDYINLQKVDFISTKVIIAIAVFIGPTRLIDNVIYEPESTFLKSQILE